MKILMTTDTIGGVWTYAMTLCQALEASGTYVALVTMGGPLSRIQRDQVSKLTHVRLYESHYRLCWMDNSDQDVTAAGEWLLQLEREIEPDVIHLNDLGHGNLPWQAPMLLVAHSCVFSWWQAVHRRPPPMPDWRRYHTLVSEGIANADRVITPTKAMLKALRQHYSSAFDDTTAAAVVANGRDFPKWAPDLNINNKQPRIFGAGRIWDEAKNLALVAKVAPQLEWPVYIAGEHTAPDGYVQDYAGLRALGFLGEAEMEHQLRRAAIYVAPAKYEPFGLAILEAARAGCALVLSDIDSLREVWGSAASYVDPDQPDSLVATIHSLIKRPDDRHKQANAAWKRAQAYTAACMADTYLTHYQAITRRHRAAPPIRAQAPAGARS